MFELVLRLEMGPIFTMFWAAYAASNTKTDIATATAQSRLSSICCANGASGAAQLIALVEALLSWPQ